MQFKRLVMASVCALALQGAAFAQAADDVYVDLSVLNNLQPGDSLFVETQPLFPVVKKAPVKKTVRKKKTPKKTVAPAKPVAEKTPAPKKEEKAIAILPQAPEIPQPLAEAKPEPVKPANPITVADDREPVRETVADVDVVRPAETDNGKALSEPKSEETSKPAAALIEPAAKVEPAKTEVSVPAAEETAKAPEKAAAVQEAENVPAAETEEKKEIKPLLPVGDKTPAAAEVGRQIFFADDSFEISPENADKIVSLIETFEDPRKHKIAIYAYNYDNGENTFKKKKLSLDRATEIRSLLLNKGYKNFSIKVINITDNPEKRNLVEIEEIK
ncbi:MAG: OmpA family protein [Alphaproteobacteria bacterium]